MPKKDDDDKVHLYFKLWLPKEKPRKPQKGGESDMPSPEIFMSDYKEGKITDDDIERGIHFFDKNGRPDLSKILTQYSSGIAKEPGNTFYDRVDTFER